MIAETVRQPPVAPSGGAIINPHLAWALELTRPFGETMSLAAGLAAAYIEDGDSGLDRVDGGPLLNLYLLVCALDQVLADYLHGGQYDFTRLPRLPGKAKSAAQLAGHALELSLRRKAAGRRGRLVRLEAELAAWSIQISPPWDGSGVEELRSRLEAWTRAELPAELAGVRFKVPSAFRTMDVDPEDCLTFARRAARELHETSAPVLVVGLRTSGLYMAPIAAAEMRRLGFPDVRLFSLRPGVGMLPHEKAMVAGVAAAGGSALVMDDPTWTGASYGKATAQLEQCGLPFDRMLLAVCRIDNQLVFRDSPAARKRSWSGFAAARKIVLEPSDWALRRRLDPLEVERTLNQPLMLRALEADHVQVLAAHPFTDDGHPPVLVRALNGSVDGGGGNRAEARRHHLKAIFELQLARGRHRTRRFVLAKGVGIGFFGYHSHLIALALHGLVPTYIGLDRGLMFTDWVVGQPLRADVSRADVNAIADYVAERGRRLRLPAQAGTVYEGKHVDPGSRRIARYLGRALGRAGSLIQFRLSGEIATALAAAPRAVIDGGGSGVGRELDPVEWLRPRDAAGKLLKTDFEEHCFDLRDRSITDPAFDLAAASSALRLDAQQEQALVASYAARSGDLQVEDRLLYHKLLIGGIKLDSAPSTRPAPDASPADRSDYARRLADYECFLSDAVNGFLARHLLAGLDVGIGNADVWGIDLDDVLESNKLGFRASSPAGLTAIRRLRAHGHVPLICSGRSLSEVQVRCRMYGLVGGVAEYGSVLWDERDQMAIPLVDAESLRALARLRAALTTHGSDLFCDPRYSYCLRVFKEDHDGRSGAGAADTLKALVDRLGLEGLRVNEGWKKALVLAPNVSKGAGLEALVARLGLRDRTVRAVGEDSGPDLSLLRAASVRYAPGNLDQGLRKVAGELNLRVVRPGFQAGLLAIVVRALHGHSAACDRCQEPPPPKNHTARTGLRLLGLQDVSRSRKLALLLHPTVLRTFEQ